MLPTFSGIDLRANARSKHWCGNPKELQDLGCGQLRVRAVTVCQLHVTAEATELRRYDSAYQIWGGF